jgi:hypothetical protein
MHVGGAAMVDKLQRLNETGKHAFATRTCFVQIGALVAVSVDVDGGGSFHV